MYLQYWKKKSLLKIKNGYWALTLTQLEALQSHKRVRLLRSYEGTDSLSHARRAESLKGRYPFKSEE